MFKVNNWSTRKRCETCWKLIIKTLEQSQWLRSGVAIVNFGYIPHKFSGVFCTNAENTEQKNWQIKYRPETPTVFNEVWTERNWIKFYRSKRAVRDQWNGMG